MPREPACWDCGELWENHMNGCSSKNKSLKEENADLKDKVKYLEQIIDAMIDVLAKKIEDLQDEIDRLKGTK